MSIASKGPDPASTLRMVGLLRDYEEAREAAITFARTLRHIELGGTGAGKLAHDALRRHPEYDRSWQ